MKLAALCFLPMAFVQPTSCHDASVTKQKVVVKTEPGIHFIENDWDLAVKTAQTENKLLFIDIYATWCGPCKMLKQYTFTDSALGEFFNKNFVSISIDGEKGLGPQLAEKYSIEGYPTLIVTDTTGKPVLLTAGYMPTDVLMQFANEAIKRSGVQVKM